MNVSRLWLLLYISVFSNMSLGDLQQKTLMVDDIPRQYLVYRPQTLSANAPLVMVFHGYTSSASRIMNYSDMNDQADDNGFIVAYPQGTRDLDGNRFFNVEYSLPGHQQSEVDDILFVRLLVAKLIETFDIDPHSVFATGMSNGGEMAYLLACRASDLFAGIASVAGTMMDTWASDCNPESLMPVLSIHGTHDEITWFGGDPEDSGGWGAYRSQQDIRNFWVQHNELDQSITTSLADLDPEDESLVRLMSYWSTGSDVQAKFYIVENGGHDWPGLRYDWWNPLYVLARYQMGFGRTRDIDSSKIITDFFVEVARRGRAEPR